MRTKKEIAGRLAERIYAHRHLVGRGKQPYDQTATELAIVIHDALSEHEANVRQECQAAHEKRLLEIANHARCRLSLAGENLVWYPGIEGHSVHDPELAALLRKQKEQPV